MTNANSLPLLQNTIEYQQDDILLEKIPDEIYDEITDMFFHQYHFNVGEKSRFSNYFVKISRSLSDAFVGFIKEINKGLLEEQFPAMSSPEGFEPCPQNLLEVESNGGFSLGSFDMAITNKGIQNIEFQAVATYPFSAAILNKYLLDNMALENAFIFADSPKTNWDDFINLYNTIIGGNQKEGIVIVDRKAHEQETKYEFFATQKQLDIPIEIVDMEHIFEKQGELFYSTPSNQSPIKITRLYNRVILAEALFEDDYPHNKTWKFRFDKNYKSLKFINHPIKQFEVSKRLSPYIHHPYNPACFELSEVVQDFRNGKLKYEDYVWKHKWGASGHRLILEPNENILEELSDYWQDYIAQKNINFKIFKTDDNQEKIVELRFMTAVHNKEMIIVPMARIGHVVKSQNGNTLFKIHCCDNNKAGYGFSPVIIFDDKK